MHCVQFDAGRASACRALPKAALSLHNLHQVRSLWIQCSRKHTPNLQGSLCVLFPWASSALFMPATAGYPRAV